MPKCFVAHVFLCLVTAVRSDTECSPKPITCHAGTFALGEPAAVSCNLYGNMNACRLNVSVVHYSPDDFNNDPGKDIVSCLWNETKKSHRCKVDKGYDFNCEIGDNPKLEIPTVKNDSAGFYMCYVMSAESTQTHVCKLSTRDRPHNIIRSTTTLSPTRPSIVTQDVSSKKSPVIAVLITTTVLMTVVVAILILLLWCRRQRKGYQQYCNVDQKDSEQMLCETGLNNGSRVEGTSPHPDKQIEAELRNFRMEKTDLGRIEQLIRRQLNESRTKSSTTCIKYLPVKKEAYRCLVLVLFEASLKVMLMRLQSGTVDVHASANYSALQTTGTGERIRPPLVDFAIRCVIDFVKTHNLSGDLPLGVVFSCPCEYSQDTDQGINTVTLTEPIKGFECVDVIDKSLRELLQQVLRQENGGHSFEIKAFVNDAVDVLRAAHHQDSSCTIAIVLGNRFNASYLMERGAQKLLVTTDCGFLGDGGRLDLYMTEFDRMLDQQSENNGKHILDKMISGAYMGGLVRVVLVELKRKGLLFKCSSESCDLFKRDSFLTDYIYLIGSDMDGNYHNTHFVLRQLGVEGYTNADCEIVRHVCMVISERAAHLAAAGLAAIIRHIDQREVTVALDSSPYLSRPLFAKRLQEKTSELLGENYELRFTSCCNETGKGAALLAATT